jgi:hypothetical protein
VEDKYSWKSIRLDDSATVADEEPRTTEYVKVVLLSSTLNKKLPKSGLV